MLHLTQLLGTVVSLFVLGIGGYVAYSMTGTYRKRKQGVLDFIHLNKLTPMSKEMMEKMFPPSLPAGAGMSHAYLEGYMGVFKGTPVYMFNARTKDFAERYEKTYGVVIVRTTKKYPHIYMDSRSNGMQDQFEDWQKLSLEGDFDKYFNVYSEENMQNETLTFLTPDVMERLIDNAAQYDVEIYAGNIALISRTFSIYEKNILDEFFKTLDVLLPKLNVDTKIYAETGFAPVSDGLKRRSRIPRVIVGVLVIIFIILTGFAALFQ
jgi:hypothetical protein